MRLLVIPVDGTFADWWAYEEPFDRSLADEGADRWRTYAPAWRPGRRCRRTSRTPGAQKWCQFFSLCREPRTRRRCAAEITDPELARGGRRATARRTPAIRPLDKERKRLAPLIRGLRGITAGGLARSRSAGPARTRPVIDEDAIRADYAARGEHVPMTTKPGNAPRLTVTRIKAEGGGGMTEPLTSRRRAKLRSLVTELTRAQAALAQARDLEVDARHEYDRAKRRALLSEKSPKVTRGGYTVAEQSAWVDDQCGDLKFAADKATVIREAAQDRLRVLLAQAEIVRSLGASVRTAYELAGRGAGGLAGGAVMKRTAQLNRRTPIRARRAGSLDNCPPEAVAEAVAAVLAGLATVAQAARDAGADPGAVQLLAWDRARTAHPRTGRRPVRQLRWPRHRRTPPGTARHGRHRRPGDRLRNDQPNFARPPLSRLVSPPQAHPGRVRDARPRVLA